MNDKKPITFYARPEVYDWLMRFPAGFRSYVINDKLKNAVDNEVVETVIRAIIEASTEPTICEPD